MQPAVALDPAAVSDAGTLAAVVGIATVVSSIAVKLIGMPDQIRENHRRRSTEGMSVWLWVLSLVSYVCWTAHGLLRGDWVVVSAQVLGVVLSALMLAQAWWYRRK